MVFGALCVILYIQLSLGSTVDRSKYMVTIGRPSNESYSCTAQICCNGVVHTKKNDNTGCCGNQTYNQQTQFCCGFIVRSKRSDEKCCNNLIYNHNTHKCELNVLEVTMDDGQITSWTTESEQEVITPIREGSYTECGNGMIYYKTHICCEGKPVPITNTNSAYCCGRKAYDRRKNFCCSSHDSPKLLPPVHNGENLCCNGKPYNGLTEACIVENGTIIAIPTPDQQLCNNQIINKKENICCTKTIDVQGKPQQREWIIAKQKEEHTECCENLSFSPSDKICCQGKLIDRDGIHKCCYGSGPYDPSKDTCCRSSNYITDDAKSKLYSNKLGKCCYLNLYDETKEACCGIAVIPKQPADKCGCCTYNVNGAQATLDELISSFKIPVDLITGY